jgi:UDP-N-acetylmuramoylalanine--D-glutamate ligase
VEEARDDAMALGAVPIGDPIEIDLIGFAGVVVSPGVPLNRHPIARTRARRRARHRRYRTVRRGARRPAAAQGRRHHRHQRQVDHHRADPPYLESAGVPSLMGGNIGLPILARDPLPMGGVYVLELSSYQIDLTHSLACDVAVLLNLTPDHLDRYDGFEGYAASKARLFAMQSAMPRSR